LGSNVICCCIPITTYDHDVMTAHMRTAAQCCGSMAVTAQAVGFVAMSAYMAGYIKLQSCTLLLQT